MNKRIDLNDPTAWSEFDWSDPVVPEALKKTDGQVARARGVRLNKDKIAKASKENWKNEEYVAKRAQSQIDSNSQPEVKARRKEAGAKMSADPKWIAKQKAGVEAFRNDPVRLAEQKKNNKAAYLKAKEDPAYWEAYYAAIKVRDADPEYHKKRIDASKKKICRRVQTPLGVFDSITDAANAHGMGNTETMRNRLKSPNFPDFLLLDDVAEKPKKENVKIKKN